MLKIFKEPSGLRLKMTEYTAGVIWAILASTGRTQLAPAKIVKKPFPKKEEVVVERRIIMSEIQEISPGADAWLNDIAWKFWVSDGFEASTDRASIKIDAQGWRRTHFLGTAVIFYPRGWRPMNVLVTNSVKPRTQMTASATQFNRY
jgi:hypothetical protein